MDVCKEQSCRKLYVAIVMKIYFPQFMGGCFIMGFLLFGVYGVPLLYCAEM